jgi:hypothetical protein
LILVFGHLLVLVDCNRHCPFDEDALLMAKALL